MKGKDFSILVVKPEVVESAGEILKYVEDRGYVVIKRLSLNKWIEFAEPIYNEFDSNDLAVYLLAYHSYSFPDHFVVIILTHKEGNTIEKLKSLQGHYLDYQRRDDPSLRAAFGLDRSFNVYSGDRIFTFSGIHCVTNEIELLSTLEYLQVS